MAITTTNSSLTEDLANGAPHPTNLSVAVNTSDISGALDFRNLVLGGIEDVSGIHVVSYQVVLPLMLALGMMLSAAGLFLLTRPRLRTRPANKYYLLLVSCDLLVLLVCVPSVITLNGCRLSSYSVALYLFHGSNTVFYILQTFTLYLLLWVSYDRFLGLWYFKRFHEVQTRRVFRNRMVLTVVVCVATHLKHLLQVEVTCSGSIRDVDGTCEGVWVIDDELHYLGRHTVLEMLLWVARGLLVLAVPVVFVLTFNVGVVVGLVRRRLHNTAATPKTRRQAFAGIYIALTFSATFVVSAVPIAVYTAFYADKIHKCHGSPSEEILRAVANLLMLGEHLTHFLFLSFNETFRTELQNYVASLLRHTRDAFRHACSRLRPQERALDVPPSAVPAQESVPSVFISTPEVRSEDGGGVPLQHMASLSPLDASYQSPRASTFTIEEVI